MPIQPLGAGAPAQPAAQPATSTPARPAPADTFGTSATSSAATRVNGPYVSLIGRDVAGYVRTASGKDVFVSVKLGRDPAKTQPVVMLDGLAARYERNQDFEKAVQANGQTIISVYLPGQGETLAKDLETTGGASIRADIEQEQQAKAVVEVLDALGVRAPVSIAGLSYGGAIAAQAERSFPERFDKVMLIAPFIRSQGKANPFLYNSMMNNPWNPMGPYLYRQAAKATLQRTFPTPPEVLKPHGGAFHEALYRLSLGLEDFELGDSVKSKSGVHFLVVPDDSASPPSANQSVYRGVSSGSFTTAPDSTRGKHDLVRADTPYVAEWISKVMSGQIPAEAVR